MIKRLFAALLLVLAVVTPAFSGVTLPWTKFSEQAKSAVNSDMGSCGAEQEFITVYFQEGKDAYRTFYGISSNRYIVLFYEGNVDGQPPSQIGIGAVDPKANDNIPPLEWITLEQAKARYPSLCNALFPQSA